MFSTSSSQDGKAHGVIARGMRVKRVAATGVAVSAAAALTAGIAPPAAQESVRTLAVALAAASTQPSVPCGKDGTDKCYPFPTYGIGVLGGLLTGYLNYQDLNPLLNPLLNDGGLDFVGGASTTRGIYNKVNALPFYPTDAFKPEKAACKEFGTTACRQAIFVGTDIGTLGTADTINALIESAKGQTRQGFDPLAPTTGTGNTYVTAFTLLNQTRPDGGFAARFLGTPTQIGGVYGPNKDGSKVVSWNIDLGWAYNPFGDYPVTANPFALANTSLGWIPPAELVQDLTSSAELLNKVQSVFGYSMVTAQLPGADGSAGEPFNIITPAQCAQTGNDCGGNGQAAGQYLQSIFFALPGMGGTGTAPWNSFIMAGTITCKSSGAQGAKPCDKEYGPAPLPILYPTEILPALVNPLLTQFNSPYLLGNPLGDILAPPMKILVNTGYTDVITPDNLTKPDTGAYANGCPDACKTFAQEGYTAYDRTFRQNPSTKAAENFTPVPFSWFKNPAMTAEEMGKVPGDAWNAFTGALKAQSEKPAFGVLIPNPANPPAPAAVPAVEAAPAPAAADAAPVEPVAIDDDAVAATVPTGVASKSAPAVTAKSARASADSGAADSDTGGRQHRQGRG